MSLSAKDHFNYLRFPFPLLISVFGVFDYVLYGILTFMAILSVLVFIEECIYIYRKVPTNKKSVIIWVNGAAPVRRVCRKEKQMLLVQMFNCVFTWCFRHSFSLFQTIGAMSCLGMWIPKATMFTDMFSSWWVFFCLSFLLSYSLSISHCAVCFSHQQSPAVKEHSETWTSEPTENWKQEYFYVMCEVSFTILLIFPNPWPDTFLLFFPLC